MSVFKPIKVNTIEELNSLPKVDGQLIFVTNTKKIYLDNNNNRNEMNNICVLTDTSSDQFENFISQNAIPEILIISFNGEDFVFNSIGFYSHQETTEFNTNYYYRILSSPMSVIIPWLNNDETSFSKIQDTNLLFLVGVDNNNKVTNFGTTDEENPVPIEANYLDTNIDYSAPYMPKYNGSPATKKYVDNSIKTAIGDALGGSY